MISRRLHEDSSPRRSGPVLSLALGILFACVLALTPASALGSTASVSGQQLIYTAAAGETNNVAITGAGITYTIDDPGATITPVGPACAAVDSNTVNCTSLLGFSAVTVSLADMGDTLTSTVATASTVSGGDGNDTLTTSTTGDTLNGEGGDDVLDGSTGADVFNGGPGTDLVTYASRVVTVTASIDGVANDGPGGEADDVQTDVEKLSGGSAGDTLTGSTDANVLTGNGGNDTLNGGDGTDTLDGGTGGDTHNGGASTDSVSYASRSANVTVDLDGAADDGEAGENDNLAADIETITGGSGNDSITGSSVANTFDGGAGNDTLDGGTGIVADVFNGGDGSDTISYGSRSADVTVDLDGVADDGESGENDSIATDIENVTGGSGNDALTGNSGANTVSGGAGSDTLDGGTGADTFVGGTGAADVVTYALRGANVTADIDGSSDDGESGENDNVGTDVENLTGGTGNDTLTGSSSANTLSGGSGTDTLDGGTGADVLNGGTDGDTATYASRSATVTADIDGSADDGETLEGDNVQTDIENLTGGSGNDILTGRDGAANTLDGSTGNDTLDGGTGADVLNGGGGTADIASYASRTGDVTADIDGSPDDGEASEADNVQTDVENLTGGSGNDTFTGSSSANTLSGGTGTDTLDGGTGADTFSGGGGSSDVVTYASRSADVTADIDGSADDGESAENDNVGTDVENLAGGSGNDTLTASSAANTLTGGNGNDTLDGGTGADVLNGGAGTGDAVTYASRSATVTADIDGVADDGESGENDNVGTDVENLTGGSGGDALTGDSGANSLTGGAGDDTIEGGEGVDTLTGEGGADTLRSRDASGDSVSCGSESDSVIADTQDSVAADCEFVDLGSSGGGGSGGGGSTGGGGGSTPPPSGGGGGTTPVPAGTISIKTRKATMSKRGVIAIRMNCKGGPCSSGTVNVETAAKVRLAAKPKPRKVKLGNYKFSAVASGRVVTIKVKLSAKLRKLVLAKKSLSLRVKAVSGRRSVSATVRCLAPKARKKRKR